VKGVGIGNKYLLGVKSLEFFLEIYHFSGVYQWCTICKFIAFNWEEVPQEGLKTKSSSSMDTLVRLYTF